MATQFKSVGIIGAGVMGSQIALSFADLGVRVVLLDIQNTKGESRNKIVQDGWARVITAKSPPLAESGVRYASVRLGNTSDDLHLLGECDLIIEAIPERMEWKKALFQKIVPFVKKTAIIGTNTSGLSVAEMTAGLPEWFCQNFLVTHFFNPVRYQPLLELVAGPLTSPDVLWAVQDFAENQLGKQVLIAKPTPDFIANHIGMYYLFLCIKAFVDGVFTISEIDAMCGVLVSRPKSAIFRTADLVGLPVLKANADNLAAHLPTAEQREFFTVPKFIEVLISRGSVGANSGEGFYKKEGKNILALDLETMSYTANTAMDLPGLDAIEKIKDPHERLRALYELEGRVGDFFRETTLKLLAYCANQIPAIADRPEDIDFGIRYGYGWEIPPFELWDTLGFLRVAADIKLSGLKNPEWVRQLVNEGRETILSADSKTTKKERIVIPAKVPALLSRLFGNFIPSWRERVTYVNRPLSGSLDLAALDYFKGDKSLLLQKWAGGILIDVGDGVALFSFESKANTIGSDVITAVNAALDWVNGNPDFSGLVVANSGKDFCLGANLGEVYALQLDPTGTAVNTILPGFVDRFQQMILRLYTNPKPIVGIIQGLALGGGAEFAARLPHQIVRKDAMLGLVEMGVGLIPAGTGTTLLATHAAMMAPNLTPYEVMPWLTKVFEQIALGKVSGGATQAIEMGLLNQNAHILRREGAEIDAAKYLVRSLAANYAAPISFPDVYVTGEIGRSILRHRVYTMYQQGFASEHDLLLAYGVIDILTGGADRNAPGFCSAEELLQRERDVFVKAAATSKTKDRVAHMLTTGKVLRN